MGSCTTAPRENGSYAHKTNCTPIKYNTVQNSIRTSCDYRSESNNVDNITEAASLIDIAIHVTNDENKNDTLMITSFPYKQCMTITHLLQAAIAVIHNKYYPKVYIIRYIKKESFVVSQTISQQDNKWRELLIKSITDYEICEIRKHGLKIFIVNEYEHKPNELNDNSKICEYMMHNNHDPLKCPIYRSMIHYSDFTQDNFNHLLQFEHVTVNNEKPQCEYYNDKCQSLLNLEKGGNELYDKCHMKLYLHRPRHIRQINIAANMDTLFHSNNNNQQQQENHPIYEETNEDTIKYKWNQTDGFMTALIVEVIENGYSSDLALCANSANTNNIRNISCNWSVLSIVNEKLKHIRHQQIDSPLNRGEMLALILYTNGQCSYDLCKSQRNNNYKKWKWFDYNLYNAIRQLSRKETGQYQLYAHATATATHINKKKIRQLPVQGYFATYQSTAWNKKVVLDFILNNNGLMIEIDQEYRQSDTIYCCDVSWISSFMDECEVLIARSVGKNKFYAPPDTFTLSMVDDEQTNGIQTISLQKAKSPLKCIN